MIRWGMVVGGSYLETARDLDRAASTQLMFYTVTLSWDEHRRLPLSKEITFALAGRAMQGVRR